jgi:hypothetical protein
LAFLPPELNLIVQAIDLSLQPGDNIKKGELNQSMGYLANKKAEALTMLL